ncbi:MAG: Phosphoglycolate phosphatase [Methanoregulaceae archaeon PtaB.Bin056]|nr:MAG: Phosphoglycolate phosphatase [Methanoregulaceae archaeon PtaB.Bin056]
MRLHIRNRQMERSLRLRGLVTDIDGTITDQKRRIHTGAIDLIRELMDEGIFVILASGNTSCFMDAVSKMIGTPGTYIGENGGIIRNGYSRDIVLLGDGVAPRNALKTLVDAYRTRGIEIEHYSLPYRFVDVAFARTVPPGEVREIVRDHPVEVLDTGFAIHIHPPGVNKGIAFSQLAGLMGLKTRDFLAVGDAENDIELLRRAGVGVAVANAHPDLARTADLITQREYGEGFVEGVKEYLSYFLER